MSVTEFLSRLRKLNVQVWAEGERLRVSAPAGALTEDLRAELNARRDELVEWLRPETSAPAIPRGQTDGSIPASFAQRRLWFLDQFEQGTSAYNIPLAWRLRGRLDVGALHAALNEIVRRHETLRSTFREESGAPVQRVAPAAPIQLPQHRIAFFNGRRTRFEIAMEIARREAARRIPLDAGPLFRPGLARLGDADHVLILNVHHIVFDGWSLGVFQSELAALYTAFCAGRPAPLPAPPIRDADYPLWQNEWLRGPAARSQLAYWRRQLAGELPVLDLPTDRPHPAQPDYRGRYLEFLLPADLIEPLRALGRREGATLFMTLLAAFKALLHAHRPAGYRRRHGHRQSPSPELEGSSASSSTPLSCARASPATPPSASFSAACARRRSAPSPTRTSRSKS